MITRSLNIGQPELPMSPLESSIKIMVFDAFLTGSIWSNSLVSGHGLFLPVVSSERLATLRN